MSLIIVLLSYLLEALEFVIVVWALMSWLPGAQQSKFGQLLGRIAGLVIDPIRRFMPRTGMIDFSPLVAILLLYGAQMGLIALSRFFG
jgi:YggT family protein